jgi:hypothetical protein
MINPLLVTLVPAIFAILLYFSVLAERRLQEIPIEVRTDDLGPQGSAAATRSAHPLLSEPEL